MARQVYTPCLLNILGKRSTLQLSKSRNIRAWGNSAFAERWHSNIQALPSITWSCLSRSMGVALCFRHCCLSRLQVFIHAFSVVGPVRQAPGTSLCGCTRLLCAPCMLPVRMATSDVLHAMQNSIESFELTACVCSLLLPTAPQVLPHITMRNAPHACIVQLCMCMVYNDSRLLPRTVYSNPLTL